MGPLIQGYFSIVSITVLHGLWLTWICMCGGLIISYTQINPHFVQGSTINIHICQPPRNTHIHTHTKIEKYVWGLVYIYAFSSSVHWDGPKQWLSNRDEHPGSRSWFPNTIFLDMIDTRSMASWMIHHSRGFPFPRGLFFCLLCKFIFFHPDVKRISQGQNFLNFDSFLSPSIIFA